jgi:ABC-type transport system substrate-binding protein
MPPEVLSSVAGYDPDVAKSREAAREMMKRLGYGPDKRLAIKVAARNIANYRDPAVILIDQMKEIWIDGELETVETANWFPKVTRKDYQIGVNVTAAVSTTPTSSSSRITAVARRAAANTVRRTSATRSLRWQPARRSRKSPLRARALAPTMSAPLALALVD